MRLLSFVPVTCSLYRIICKNMLVLFLQNCMRVYKNATLEERERSFVDRTHNFADVAFLQMFGHDSDESKGNCFKIKIQNTMRRRIKKCKPNSHQRRDI